MVAVRTTAMIGLFAATAIGAAPALSQDANMRGRILEMILGRITCCSTDMRFTRPANAANVPSNFGIGVAPGSGGDALIQLGQIARGPDGKPAFRDAYSLDASCRPIQVQGVALAPGANFYTVTEIAGRDPKNSPEELWPVANATFQSTLLGAFKLPSPPARHTCLRQHLERVIHGEEGSQL